MENLSNKTCFISVVIDGKRLIFRNAKVIEDTQYQVLFLDNKTQKVRSFNKSVIEEIKEENNGIN